MILCIYLYSPYTYTHHITICTCYCTSIHRYHQFESKFTCQRKRSQTIVPARLRAFGAGLVIWFSRIEAFTLLATGFVLSLSVFRALVMYGT